MGDYKMITTKDVIDAPGEWFGVGTHVIHRSFHIEDKGYFMSIMRGDGHRPGYVLVVTLNGGQLGHVLRYNELRVAVRNAYEVVAANYNNRAGYLAKLKEMIEIANEVGKGG